jgi:preprotein translocase subunit SecG
MQVLNIFHVLIAIALIGFVLIQRGQGATAGAAFGSGASGTVFGARGAGNFLTRSTWVLAALFCAISLTMAVMVSRIMTEVPTTDLGVVAATEQPEQDAQQQPVQERSLGNNEPGEVDVPAFEPAAEDVPGLDEGANNAAESAGGKDLPAAPDVEGAPKANGDDG